MKPSSKENIQTHGSKREQPNNVLETIKQQQNNNNKANKTKLMKPSTKEHYQTHRNEKEDTIGKHISKIEQHVSNSNNIIIVKRTTQKE